MTRTKQDAENIMLDKAREVGRAHGIPEKIADDVYGVGHNSGDTTDVGGVSGTRLKSFVERIERLTEEKKAIAEDIRDCYSEAKATGFDAPTIRKLVSERKKSLEKRREQLELFELYSSAIGMAE